jgi:predicted nucleic acid-binding Zn ribbon protein
MSCGKELEAQPCRPNKQFCSVKCHDEWQRRNRIQTKCKQCSVIFGHPKSIKKFFCSQKCQWDYENKKQWSPEVVIAEIRKLQNRNSDLNAIFIRDNHLALFKAGNRMFGDWNSALKEAGINPEKIRLDRKTSSYKGLILEQIVEELYSISGIVVERKPMINGCQPDFVESSTNLWVDVKLRSWPVGIDKTIERYLKQTDRLQVIFLGGGDRHWPTPEVQFIWLFDKFPILKEMQENSDLVQRIREIEKQDIKDKKFKIWSETWSQERIIEELLTLYNNGRPLKSKYLIENHPRLYGAIGSQRYFNNWADAIRACGLDPETCSSGKRSYHGW